MPIFPYNRQIFHAQAEMTFLESAEWKNIVSYLSTKSRCGSFAIVEKGLVRDIAHTPERRVSFKKLYISARQ